MYFNFLPLYIGNKRNYLPKKKNDSAKKKDYLRYIFFYLRGVTRFVGQVFDPKKRRKPFVYGLSPLRYTKIIHFRPKSKLL